MKTNWKHNTGNQVASRTNDQGQLESRLVSAIPEGETIEAADPPTAEEIAEEAQRVADEQAKADAKADATVRYLVTHTTAEIIAKVNADVTDLASARQMIARLAVAIGAGLRKELR